MNSLIPQVPVSVAVPVYGQAASLARTLRLICGCNPRPQEILIHCDAGGDVEVEPLPVEVRILRSPMQVGPGGGRHIMFREAACEIIASFDDDSWPLDEDYFARALAVMKAFPQAAVMSPAVYLKEKPVMPPMREMNTARSFEGSASVHRRSLYLKLPGYVPVPSAYGVEEADLSLQATAAGYQILACPWLRAWHDRPRSDNERTVVPWIQNEVLLAYLRYPRLLRPWGGVRALRRIWRQRGRTGLPSLLRALALSVPRCMEYRAYVRRYTVGEVWRHHRSQSRRFEILTEKDRAAQDETLVVREAPPAKKVLYIQYTNPGGYPPLEHGARMLARRGWEVEFLGLRSGSHGSLDFAPHPRITMRRMAWCGPGPLQKLHYLAFLLRCLWRAWRWRADWIYCSDALSTPAGWLAFKGLRRPVVYHEHDSPEPVAGEESRFQRWVRVYRGWLAREACAVVLPNARRLEALEMQVKPRGRTFCVWNCPGLDEVPAVLEEKPADAPLRVLYHGSIVPDRFGVCILEALAKAGPGIIVRLMGYEGPGCPGYVDELLATAAKLGVAPQFEWLGTIPTRVELMALGAECDVGLCMLRVHDADINMRHMTGASNKPFDYLSQGLALIVAPDPEWTKMYVESGCAVACPLGEPERLAETFQWLRDHRQEVCAMGMRGHALVRSEWNYEAQFAPVVECMENAEAARA